MPDNSAWRFCVAPMMDWTTPACRQIHRILLPKARLYSEMITTGAILFGDAQRYLTHQNDEPCALQLGGSNPDELARATAIAQSYHYAEMNLNVGCPSDRVQNNQIGACLMKSPRLVAQCLTAMQKESDVPVSIKHRLGTDEQDEHLVFDFVDQISQESPCRIFIVHARKAWLSGLSPKENRTAPPLHYEIVYKIKEQFPELIIIINGGIDSIAACQNHLHYVDGVMLGRAAYQQPQLLLAARALFGDAVMSETEIVPQITQLLMNALDHGERLHDYTRHLLGLFHGKNGAKRFRQILSECAPRAGSDINVWQQALAMMAPQSAIIQPPNADEDNL